jgi:hypothetical protein
MSDYYHIGTYLLYLATLVSDPTTRVSCIKVCPYIVIMSIDLYGNNHYPVGPTTRVSFPFGIRTGFPDNRTSKAAFAVRVWKYWPLGRSKVLLLAAVSSKRLDAARAS